MVLFNRENFETFEQVYEDRFEREHGFFRSYVRQLIHRYLDCGVLHNDLPASDARTAVKSISWH